jgi:predicted dehydrogenase
VTAVLSTPLPRARRPRLGFLGTGWIGRHRLEAIARSGLAEIVAIADVAKERATEARGCASEAAVLGSYEEMLDAALDGVVIATPSAMHAEQAVAALERGLAVFCQKPLGRTAQEARRVVWAARAADRLLGVDLSYRYSRGMQRVRELVRSGALGAVYAVNLTFHNAYGPDKGWFYDPALSGGGCLIDLGTHLVDLALWTLGFPRVIGASGRLLAGGAPVSPHEPKVEDYACARLDLAGGAVVQLACSWRLSAGCDAAIEAAFYGTKAGAAFRNVNGSFYDFKAECFHGTRAETLCAPPDEWGARAAVEWARRLAAGARFDIEAERFVEVAGVLDALYARGSATLGRG